MTRSTDAERPAGGANGANDAATRRAGAVPVGAALFVFAAVLFLARCWDGVLLEDTARYAAVAKSILATGDWVTMHETPARPYFNKPPLYFWATAVLFRLFGATEWAARFWSGLAGAGAAVLLYDTVRRFAGWRTGLLAGVVLVLTNDFLRYGATGRLDAPLVFCMALAAWSFARWTAGGRRWWLAGVGAACGLGVLVKGPPVLVMPVALVAAAAGAGRLRRFLANPALWAGLLLGIAIAAPWHLAVARANPGFWDHYVGREMVDRLEGDWKTGKPRTHYLGVLLEHGLPWTPFWIAGLWMAAARLLRRSAPPPPGENGEAEPDHPDAAFAALMLAWLAVAAAAAFAPPRMYGRYLVLMHPPLAGLGAWALARILPDRVFAHLRRRLWIYGVAAAVLICALPFTRHEDPQKTAVPAAARLTAERLPPGEPVPLYLTEIHAPRAVVWFYTDRESRVLAGPDEARGAPVIWTSKAGAHHLQPYGYRAAVRSGRLWAVVRADEPDPPPDGPPPPGGRADQ